MFTLPNLPSQSSSPSELADFFELLSIKQGQASKSDVANHLGIVSDNLYNIGCDDDDDQIADLLDEVLIEIQRRRDACNGGYPFDLNHTGTLLKYQGAEQAYSNHQKLSYIYLLLSTRLNMNSSKTHNEIDGTVILEELASLVLRSYLGSRSLSINFGTSVSGGFAQKVNDLCRKIGEGGQHKIPPATTRYTQDGKLDTVGWIPFTDELAGKLVIFGQCKTGTNWKDSVTQLQPLQFIKKFMTGTYHLDPVRAFFVSESIDRSKWHDFTIDAGLLFDRCRIVDFCPSLPDKSQEKVMRWTTSALQSITLQ